MSAKPDIHPIDRRVGARVRLRRRELGISQTELAHSLGLTFQQVQKYESGANRISASKLYDIATCLHAPIETFFDGVPGLPDDPAAETSGYADTLQAFLTSQDGLELATRFTGLRPPLRRRILDLVRALSEHEGEAARAG